MASISLNTTRTDKGCPLPLDLPTDLFLHHVLIYLDSQTLLHATSINTTFKRIGRDDLLWETRCDTLWNQNGGKYGLRGKPLRVYHDAGLTREAWKGCKIKELKQVLQDRRIRYRARFLEKKEFVDAIVRSNVQKKVLFHHKWFSSYFYSMQYGRRKVPNIEDLCCCKWIMHFKAEMRERMEASGSQIPTIVGEFSRNYEYKSTPQFSNHELSWQFVQMGNITAVQIAQYPPLTFTRLANYSWTMENQYVIFFSQTPFWNHEGSKSD